MGPQCCTTSNNQPVQKPGKISFKGKSGLMDKLNAQPVTGNDSMKALRNMNLMQGHIIRRPKPHNLQFDSSDEEDDGKPPPTDEGSNSARTKQILAKKNLAKQRNLEVKLTTFKKEQARLGIAFQQDHLISHLPLKAK